MVLTVTHVFMFTLLCTSNKMYVILKVACRYGKCSSIASAGAVTAISRTVEGHIRVAGSIQENKTGPFNTAADVIIKFVANRCA